MPIDPAHRPRLERGEVITTTEEGREGRNNAKCFALIGTPPERVWDAITDYDRYKEFMPYTTESRVVSRAAEKAGTPEEVVFSSALGFSLGFTTRTIRYTIRLKLDKPKWRIDWTLVEGDVKHNDGGWQLEQAGSDTYVVYWAYVAPGFPVPGFILSKLTQGSLVSIIDAVRKRIGDWKYGP
jgi:ribosome-associated toxin RatA of RatAB toxin-antitoxin module